MMFSIKFSKPFALENNIELVWGWCTMNRFQAHSSFSQARLNGSDIKIVHRWTGLRGGQL